MADDISRLLAMHDQASAFGDGLKPELLRLLRHTASQSAMGAIPLRMRAKSAGPAEQRATEEQLSSAGIAILHPRKSSVQNKRIRSSKDKMA